MLKESAISQVRVLIIYSDIYRWTSSDSHDPLSSCEDLVNEVSFPDLIRHFQSN
jgi:hypothetical protein